MEPRRMPENIMNVVDNIVEKFNPQKIYLFSNKRGQIGKSAGFKLCIIIECDEMKELERRIYLEVDSEVPFDIVLYTPATWQELLERKGSFAERVISAGVIVHG